MPVVKNRFFLDEPDEPDAIQTTQVRYADVCDFENYCLKYNVNYDFKQFELGVNDDSYAGADKVRAKLQGMIESAYYPQSNNTVEQYIDQLQLFVKENLTDDKLNGLRSNLLSQSDTVKYAKATEQVTDKLQSVLEQMRMIFVRGAKSEQFIKTVVRITASNISVLSAQYDCVSVTNWLSHVTRNQTAVSTGRNQGAILSSKHDTASNQRSNIKSVEPSCIDLQPNNDREQEGVSMSSTVLEENTSL